MSTKRIGLLVFALLLFLSIEPLCLLGGTLGPAQAQEPSGWDVIPISGEVTRDWTNGQGVQAAGGDSTLWRVFKAGGAEANVQAATRPLEAFAVHMLQTNYFTYTNGLPSESLSMARDLTPSQVKQLHALGYQVTPYNQDGQFFLPLRSFIELGTEADLAAAASTPTLPVVEVEGWTAEEIKQKLGAVEGILAIRDYFNSPKVRVFLKAGVEVQAAGSAQSNTELLKAYLGHKQAAQSAEAQLQAQVNPYEGQTWTIPNDPYLLEWQSMPKWRGQLDSRYFLNTIGKFPLPPNKQPMVIAIDGYNKWWDSRPPNPGDLDQNKAILFKYHGCAYNLDGGHHGPLMLQTAAGGFNNGIAGYGLGAVAKDIRYGLIASLFCNDPLNRDWEYLVEAGLRQVKSWVVNGTFPNDIVVNMSFVFNFYPTGVMQALHEVNALGIMTVAGAGNFPELENASYPAVESGVCSPGVAEAYPGAPPAPDRSLQGCGDAQFLTMSGPSWDVLAYPSGNGFERTVVAGTSIAAANNSGAIALLWAQNEGNELKVVVNNHYNYLVVASNPKWGKILSPAWYYDTTSSQVREASVLVKEYGFNQGGVRVYDTRGLWGYTHANGGALRMFPLIFPTKVCAEKVEFHATDGKYYLHRGCEIRESPVNEIDIGLQNTGIEIRFVYLPLLSK